MSSLHLKSYLDNLGRSYDELVSEGVVPADKVIEVYPGALSFYLQPAVGVTLRFWADTRTFEAVNILLAQRFYDSQPYSGALPDPYVKCITRQAALELFGSPITSKGPFTMPIALKEVGGWDKFGMKKLDYDALTIIVSYDVELNVNSLAFTIKQTGYERVRAEAQSLIAASEPHRS